MSDQDLREIFEKYKTIAIVGLSSDENRPSHQVAKYLKEHGYRIIPVNPALSEVLGEKSYPSLLDMPSNIQETIEIVDVFRRSEDVSPVVNQMIKMKEVYGSPFVVWMQLGIINEEAAEVARKSGLIVVMDKCIMVEHKRLC